MSEWVLSAPLNKCVLKSSMIWKNANVIDKLKKHKFLSGKTTF